MLCALLFALSLLSAPLAGTQPTRAVNPLGDWPAYPSELGVLQTFWNEITDIAFLAPWGLKEKLLKPAALYNRFIATGTAAAQSNAPGGVGSNLALWLKADAGASSTTDGAMVTTWSDQSGNGNNATEPTNAPAFANNSADNINFNPALRFDGANDRLSVGDLSAIKGGSNYALFAVGVREDSASNYVFGSAGGTTNQDVHFGYVATNSASLRQWTHALDMTVANFDAPGFTPYLLFGEFNGSGHLLQELRDQAFTQATDTNTTGLSGTKTNYIGFLGGTTYYNGRINEVIVYNKALSAAEENQIQSYLALKYGLTLVGSGNSPQSYVNSAGIAIWDATANAAYHNGVTGIGRDDGSGLNQKQARSSGVDSGVTISLGALAATNQANSSSFGSDQQILILGHNGQPTGFSTSYTPASFTPISAYARMSRVWKVAETGALGAVNVIKSNADHLLVSNDPTFATGVTEIVLNNGIASVDFTHGQYFTFGKEVRGPGGVATNLQMWLRADDGGSSGALWQDVSINGLNSATQNTSAQQPVLTNNAMNFNPAFVFDGSDDRLNVPVTLKPAGGDYAYTYFGVAKQTGGGDVVFAVDVGNAANDAQNVMVQASGNTAWHSCSGTANCSTFATPGTTNGAIGESYRVAGSNVVTAQNNGGAAGTGTLTAFTGNALAIYVGYRAHSSAFSFGGPIPEVIFYDRDLTATERQQVRSYLALKYGETLDQATPQDYLASDGTTKMWNAATAGSYNNDIAGIGRDDASDLDQRKSKSVNSDAVVTIDKGGVFSANNSFLVWGNNGLAANAWITDTAATGYPSGKARLAREWQVQLTGTVGQVAVSVDVDDPDLNLPEVMGALYLVVDANANGSFADDAARRMTAVAPGTYTIAGITLTDGQRFTFATSDTGIRGFVFRDEDVDGIQDVTEPGLPNVKVLAIDANGIFAETVTDEEGKYMISDASGIMGSTRVTFTLPSELQTTLQPTILGSGNRTTVQFAHVGDRWAIVNAGFSFEDLKSTCESPTLVAACYNPVVDTSSADLLSFSFADGPRTPSTDIASGGIGAVWGNAFDNLTGSLYSAAMLKRHIPLGPLAPFNGTDTYTVDGVYLTGYSLNGGSFNPAAPGFTLQGVNGIDLGTVQRKPDINGKLDDDFELGIEPNIDLDAFAKVGTVGFGDADIDPFGTLWLVNLNQRTLISVNRVGLPGDGSAAPAGNVTVYPITDPGCSDGDFRPWAITFYENMGYLGVVCSAETSQDHADLQAFILSFDPINVEAGFSTAINFPLNYSRESLYLRYRGWSVPPSDWQPWTSVYKTTIAGLANPQPILSDIEFNVDGDMELGFMDRWGHQTFWGNLEAKPLTQEPKKRAFTTGGDLVHLCGTDIGWILEGKPGCPVYDRGGLRGYPAGGAGGVGEFYFFEEAGICMPHIYYREIFGGSICIGPNGRSIVSTVYFPGGEYTRGGGDENSYGFRTFSTIEGGIQGGRGMSFHGSLPSEFSCAVGRTHNMGELSCFCPPPMVEIGNRVWLDTNNDGIQDAGEAPLSGVTVELVASNGAILSSATTDARGEYYFSSTVGPSTASTRYGVGIPSTGVSVRVPDVAGANQQANLVNLFISPNDQGGDDTVDSDATPSGDDAVVLADTRGGRIDHSYDFGFSPDPNSFTVGLVPTTPAGAIKPGQTLTCSMEVSNPSMGPIDNLVFSINVPNGVTLNDANWTPSNVVGPSGPATLTLNSGDELPIGGLPPGESVSISAALDIANTLPDPTNISCAMTLASFTDTSGTPVTPTNPPPTPSDPVVITNQPVYDLAVRKTTNKTVVGVNEDITFNIEVINQGTVDASNIEIVDRYPPGFSLNALASSGWTDSSGTQATYTINFLPAGSSTVVDITLTTGATTGELNNYAEIQQDDGNDVDSQPEADESDINGDVLVDDETRNNGGDEDDHDVATLTVHRFDLALRKQLAAGEPTTTVRGADVTYVIDVFNQGDIDAFDISVVDYITDVVSLSENDANGWLPVDGNQLLTKIAGPLAPGENTRLTVTIRISDTTPLGELDNFAEILSASSIPGGPSAVDVDSTPDDGSGNDLLVDDEINNDGTVDEDDHDIASITVGRFDLALIKEYLSDTSRDGNATDGIINLGDRVVFRITVTNQGDVPAYDIRVTDHNPEGIVADDSDPILNIDNGWLTENMILNHNVLPGPLNPGESTTIDIVLAAVGPTSILYPAAGLIGTHTNIAEISSASNKLDGPPVVDDDSTPDEDPANDAGGTPGSSADNTTSGNGTGPVAGTDAATDEDDHDPAQITVQNTFDLAIIKYVVDANGIPIEGIPEVTAGEVITYEYMIENQGTEPAQSLTLIEHVPTGLVLTDANWTPSNVVGPGTATRTYSSVLAPGEFLTDTVIFQAAPDIQSGQVYTNIIEIQSASNNASLIDIDSDPDSDAANEVFVVDNDIFGNFRLDPAHMDEDDHDPAAVQTRAFEQVTITKMLATSSTIQAGQSISFTIRITNTGGAAITALPLTDNYNVSYLTYNAVSDLAGPNPATEPANDGSIFWANVIAFDSDGQLAPNETLELIVYFDTVAATTALADDAFCPNSTAGQTVNYATADGATACVGVTVDAASGKSTLGDFVWYDRNGNGVKEAGEEGIDGVRVELYEIIDTNGVTSTQFITYQITGPDRSGIDSDDTPTYGNAGVYDFVVQNNKLYQVVIPQSNFSSGGPLEGFIYTGDNASNAYNGPEPRVVFIGSQVDYNDADFPFTPQPRLAVSKTLNGVNPFGAGVDIGFTMRITNTGPVTLTVLPLEDRYSNVFLEFVGASVMPDSDEAGIITWNDLTAALGNVAPGDSISLDVTFKTRADTTLLTSLPSCSSSGHTPNIAIVTGAFADPDGNDGSMADELAVMKDADDQDCAEVQILNPTAVYLTDMGVKQSAAGVQVQWTTLTEVTLVGFRVYLSNGVATRLVNPVSVSALSDDLIPAQKTGQSTGASYSVLDAGATLNRGDAYVLEIIHTDGSAERHVLGVFSGGPVYLPLITR